MHTITRTNRGKEKRNKSREIHDSKTKGCLWRKKYWPCMYADNRMDDTTRKEKKKTLVYFIRWRLHLSDDDILLF
jgi:hypothetical protein